VQTDAVCSEMTLIICLFLQVTTVFATKLKSFTFVPLLKRLPVENRIWKKVLQAGRANQVIRLSMGPVQIKTILCQKQNMTPHGRG